MNLAKAVATVRDLPLIAVNHIEGHIYANWLYEGDAADVLPPEPSFPLLCLVVSGGHTQLVLMHDHGRYQLLGQTVDDAARARRSTRSAGCWACRIREGLRSARRPPMRRPRRASRAPERPDRTTSASAG